MTIKKIFSGNDSFVRFIEHGEDTSSDSTLTVCYGKTLLKTDIKETKLSVVSQSGEEDAFNISVGLGGTHVSINIDAEILFYLVDTVGLYPSFMTVDHEYTVDFDHEILDLERELAEKRLTKKAIVQCCLIKVVSRHLGDSEPARLVDKMLNDPDSVSTIDDVLSQLDEIEHLMSKKKAK